VPKVSAANDADLALATEYIDSSIAIQVALGYDAPSRGRRAAAIREVEEHTRKLRKALADCGVPYDEATPI
jgi:hypothetical protein